VRQCLEDGLRCPTRGKNPITVFSDFGLPNVIELIASLVGAGGQPPTCARIRHHGHRKGLGLPHPDQGSANHGQQRSLYW
jgi:hypothetical protein